MIKRLAATTLVALTAALPVWASVAETEQRQMLLACQDRLFGVPPVGAETFMETTYNRGHPFVRVVAGGYVTEHQARDINACAARTLGFQGPLHAASGGYSCPPGFRGLYRGTLYCFQ